MNNNSSSNSLKKIKINLDYLGKSIGIEIEPYKTIAQLKEKTRKIFFIINLEFKLIHSNKDLTPFDSITIGEYFKSKSKIHIKVIQLSNVNYSKEINGGQSKTEKNPYNNDIQSSYISKSNNSLEKIKINNNDNYDNNDNLNIEDVVNNYNNKAADVNKGESIILNTNSNNNDSNSVSNHLKYLCECKSNLVKTYYCRDDNSFICRNCRMEVIKKTYEIIF